MKQITVVVHGALGKVGKEIIAGVSRDTELSLIGAVDIQASKNYLDLPESGKSVSLARDLSSLLRNCHPQVIVDFTMAEAAVPAAKVAISHGIHLVSGTTGITENELKQIDELARSHNVGAVIAPNFALGAVVLMYLARIASKYFDHAEIIELHHDQKLDAPSGTALATARSMLQARGKPFIHASTKKQNISGTRGGEVEGISLHSVRLPGFVASEEVIFGGQGQTLRLRHDTINRECFVPGVILAIKEVMHFKGLIDDLGKLLRLGNDNEGI